MNFLGAKTIYNIFVKCLVFYTVNLYMCIYDLFHILLHLRHNYESMECMYVCVYLCNHLCPQCRCKVLKWISQAKCCGSVEQIKVAQDTVPWQVSVRMVTTPQVL